MTMIEPAHLTRTPRSRAVARRLRSSISVKDGKLQGDIEFATMNPKGQLAEQMAEAGFLNTSSIGFP